MEKHLILVDLDGTLLNQESKISAFNLEVIQKLINLGHEVIIVTGRANYRSQMFYDELALKSVFVNRNGAFIHHPRDDKFNELLHYHKKETINQIFNEEIKACIDQLYYESKNTIYVVKGEPSFYKNYELCQIISEDHNNEINLISMHVLKDQVNAVNEFLKTIDDIYFELYNSDEFPTGLFQIYPKCHKGNAIKLLSSYYQVPLERIIAFGDGINDIEMIRDSYLGIAMANAIPEVKNVAKVVLEETNAQNGVGKFLSQYFKL